MRLHIHRRDFGLFVPGAPRDCFVKLFHQISTFPLSSSSLQQLSLTLSDTLQVLPPTTPSPVSSSSRRRLFIPQVSLSFLLKSNSSVALRLPHSFKHPPNQDQHVPSFPCLGYRPPFHPLGLRLCRFDLCFPQQCLCWFFKPQGTRRCWSSHSR